MSIKIIFTINLCAYAFLLNIDLCFTKKCDKLNPMNVDLECQYDGNTSVCDEYSELQSGTIVRPTCKPEHKYYSSPPSYTEIKCNDEGKWDNPLIPCIPECGKPYAKPELLIKSGVVQNIGSHPWHVAIYNPKKVLICGGTIIAPRLVISAAHCFLNDTGPFTNPTVDDYKIVVSKFSNDYTVKDNDYQKTYKIADIRFPIKGYFGIHTSFESDITILILNDTINFGPTTLPACIDWSGVKDNEYLTEDTPGRVAGWGLNEHDRPTANLTTTTLPFISRKRCVQIVPKDYRLFITNDKFCAGLNGGPSVGPGDSGGGLLFSKDDIYYLRGIVSLNQPSPVLSIAAFTDVAEHIDWIKAVRNEVEIQPLKKAYLHYETLFSQINGTTDDDVIKLFNISKALEDEVIDGINITVKLNLQARLLFEEVMSRMRTLTEDKLAAAFLRNRLGTVFQLICRLINTRYCCLSQIMGNVIDNVAGALGTEALLEMIRKSDRFRYVPELISIYKAIFNKLERDGHLNTDSIIELAYHIKELMESKNYTALESNYKRELEIIKNGKLPKSVQNIVFSTKICLRNVKYHEYLFSPSHSNYSLDQDRRYVFTLADGDRYDTREPGIFCWKIQHNGNQYEIINSHFREHLYADVDASLPPKVHQRPVLIWKKGGNRSGSSWKLEPDGNYIYIKNVATDEYFFADFDNKQDEVMRFVYTFVGGDKTRDSKWEVVDCSDFEAKVRSNIPDPTKKLPVSVKNIIFSSKVCIGDELTESVLYAAGPSEYWYDNDRRNVYTVIPGEEIGPEETAKFVWTLQRNNDSDFEIVNLQFNEHLYAETDSSQLGIYKRYVRTWRKGGGREGSLWKFEAVDNYVYIKNVHTNEYLHTDEQITRDYDKRIAFTRVMGIKMNATKWGVFDCDELIIDTEYPSTDTEIKPAPQLTLPGNSSTGEVRVCIRNVRYNEYLYSTGWKATDGHRLFTGAGGKIYDLKEPAKFIWILKLYEFPIYQIINLQFDELAIPSLNVSEIYQRDILSQKYAPYSMPTESFWKFEPEGDYVYIRNQHNNEFIYALSFKVTEENDTVERTVFSDFIGNEKNRGKWEIIDCTNLESSIKSQIRVKDSTKNISNSSINIVLAPRVCIKLAYKNEYLYTARTPMYWHDEGRRNVFTWKHGKPYGPDERGKFAWKLNRNPDNNQFQIINRQFKEYLYAEVEGPPTKLNKSRYVFSWRKKGVPLGSWWKFEHDGDYFRIKNVRNNGYLFSDCCEDRYNENRFVYSFVPSGSRDKFPAYTTWEIIDCTYH